MLPYIPELLHSYRLNQEIYSPVCYTPQDNARFPIGGHHCAHPTRLEVLSACSCQDTTDILSHRMSDLGRFPQPRRCENQQASKPAKQDTKGNNIIRCQACRVHRQSDKLDMAYKPTGERGCVLITGKSSSRPICSSSLKPSISAEIPSKYFQMPPTSTPLINS
jgi:hypothetical protein